MVDETALDVLMAESFCGGESAFPAEEVGREVLGGGGCAIGMTARREVATKMGVRCAAALLFGGRLLWELIRQEFAQSKLE